MSPVWTTDVISVPDALAEIRARDLGAEGIPMFLALHGAAPAPPDSPRRRRGIRLAEQLAAVHAELVPGHRVSDDPDEVRILSEDDRLLIDAVALLAHLELHRGPARFAFAPDAEQLPQPSSPPLLRMLQALREGRFLSVVNYHNTAAATAERTRSELAGWGGAYSPVSAQDLEDLYSRGEYSRADEPLIPVFYEGYANNATVAAPALESAGLTGWFFLVTGFLDAPPDDQRAFAESHDIALVPEERDGGQPLAMTWGQAAQLARHHVVSAHTAHHVAAHTVHEADALRREITKPGERLATQTGIAGVAHAWLYGSDLAHDARQVPALAEAGVRWLFSNTGVDRVA